MEKERLEVILSNVLRELHEKTFECNSEEFIKYLRTEIGIKNSEIDNLCKSGLFPKDAEQYFINECIKFCIEFEDKNSANCLRYEKSDNKNNNSQMSDDRLNYVYNYFGINH